MSPFRLLVLAASIAQVGAGGYYGYTLLDRPEQNWLGLIICAALVIVGLASLASTRAKMRHSQSRQTTMKLNAAAMGLVLIIGAAMIVNEHHRGATDDRLQFLVFLHGAIAIPFLLNALGLGMIEHRVKRTA